MSDTLKQMRPLTNDEIADQEGPHLCESCYDWRQRKALADFGYVNDPYAEEICHKEVPQWMCFGCYKESCDDI